MDMDQIRKSEICAMCQVEDCKGRGKGSCFILEEVAALEAENKRLKCRDSCKDGEHCTYIDEMAKSLKEKDKCATCEHTYHDKRQRGYEDVKKYYEEKEPGQAKPDTNDPSPSMGEGLDRPHVSLSGPETPAPEVYDCTTCCHAEVDPDEDPCAVCDREPGIKTGNEYVPKQAPAAKCRVYERLHCVGCPWTRWAGKLGAPCVHCIYYEPEAPAKDVKK